MCASVDRREMLDSGEGPPLLGSWKNRLLHTVSTHWACKGLNVRKGNRAQQRWCAVKAARLRLTTELATAFFVSYGLLDILHNKGNNNWSKQRGGEPRRGNTLKQRFPTPPSFFFARHSQPCGEEKSCWNSICAFLLREYSCFLLLKQGARDMQVVLTNFRY